MLDAQALKRLEPNLREGMMGGLLVPEDGVLYPPCAARVSHGARAEDTGPSFVSARRSRRSGKERVRLSDGAEIAGKLSSTQQEPGLRN